MRNRKKNISDLRERVNNAQYHYLLVSIKSRLPTNFLLTLKVLKKKLHKYEKIFIIQTVDLENIVITKYLYK